MTKPIIAVDIDDTLYAHFALLVAWHNATYGTKLIMADNHPFSPVHWGTPELQQQTLARWGAASVEAAIRRVHAFFDTPEFRSAMPFPKAQSVLQGLSATHIIVAVTARDLFQESFTREWLQRYFAGVVSDVILTARYNLHGQHMDKIDVLKDIKARYIIDDDLELCVRAAGRGISAILYGDYSWNNMNDMPNGVVCCKDWQAVDEYFQYEPRSNV